MTYYTIAMVGRKPESVEASSLGDALSKLNIDADKTTFKAYGQRVDTDFVSNEDVTVSGAKNLVGA